MPAAPTVVIDGSQGEGGGQVLRTALTLSTLLRVPMRVERIRANRPKPGLQPQHLGIVRFLAEWTGATVAGAEVGSQRLTYEPGLPRPGAWTYDIGTAGSVSLFLQAVLPIALVQSWPTRLTVVGGTDVPYAPTIDWWRNVYLPSVERAGSGVELRVKRRGYYPAGGGRVEVACPGTGRELRNLASLDGHVRSALGGPAHPWGRPVRVEGSSAAAAALAGRRVAERQAARVADDIAAAGFGRPRMDVSYDDAASPGSSVAVWVVDEHGSRVGGDGIGRPRVQAEDVGAGAAASLVADAATGATVDRHLADQLVPWIGLGARPVRVPRVTAHLSTNIAVTNAFLGEGAVALDADRWLRGRPAAPG